jgi:hypothetical protein
LAISLGLVAEEETYRRRIPTRERERKGNSSRRAGVQGVCKVFLLDGRSSSVGDGDGCGDDLEEAISSSVSDGDGCADDPEEAILSPIASCVMPDPIPSSSGPLALLHPSIIGPRDLKSQVPLGPFINSWVRQKIMATTFR